MSSIRLQCYLRAATSPSRVTPISSYAPSTQAFSPLLFLSSDTMEGVLKKQRRQRAILSCNDCRRRKLKCDRLSPCDRCIKGDIAGSCVYGLEAHSNVSEEPYGRLAKKRRRPFTRPPSSAFSEEREIIGSNQDVFSGDDNSRINDLNRHLERDAAHLQQPLTKEENARRDQVEFLARSPDLKNISRPSAVMGMIKGRSYGTVFYGASSPMSVVAHVSCTHILRYQVVVQAIR